MVFLCTYLYKTGVVLRRGKCRGCSVGSGVSTMAACRQCDIGNGGWGFCIGSMRWLVQLCWLRLMCSDDMKAAIQSKIRCFLISLSFVLSWRVVRNRCCNVPQMGGSPVLFRCAKIGVFSEYGVSGRGKYGRGGGGDVGFRGSRGTRCSRGNPF